MAPPVRGRCVICTEQFLSNNIAALQCGHTFHYKCVKEWVAHSNTCPNCRIRTTDRNIVPKLFFDAVEDDSTQPKEEEDWAAKAEELTIKLKKESDELLQTRQELAETKKKKEINEAKANRDKEHYKSKLPQLQTENTQLKMMLEDQNSMQRSIDQYKRRLTACEFYQKVMRGGGDDSHLDKYMNGNQPELEEFLKIIRKQLEEKKKETADAKQQLAECEKGKRELERKLSKQHKLTLLMKTELDDLKERHAVNTPCNPKMKRVYEATIDSPADAGFGFDRSLEMNDSLLRSAFKQPVLVGGADRIVRNKPLRVIDPNADLFDQLCADSPPSTSSAPPPQAPPPPVAVPFPSLDESVIMDGFDEPSVPTVVKQRVFNKSPVKKRQLATHEPITKNTGFRVLEELEYRKACEGPKEVKREKENKVERKKTTSRAPPAKKSKGISAFFQRSDSSTSVASGGARAHTASNSLDPFDMITIE